MGEHRLERVGEQIQQEVGRLLIDGVKDPRIGFVTITGVRVSADLGHAKVFYTALGDDRALRKVASGLASSAAWLRTEIGRRLRAKRVPELEFVYDESLRRASRIEHILDELHAQGELEAPIAADPDDAALAVVSPDDEG